MSQHPRDRFDLRPSDRAEEAFEDARRRGRLHHAWLLCGPEGVGKASFAYRAARRLLGAAPDPSRGPLGARPDDPVSKLVSAQSHPDLLVLERLVENGKTKKSISVDQARDLPDFFSKSPSQAKARVAIIDAADDLNINAANALLKILEEPPEHGVLLMVTHAPGRLLATIRSRCRRLTFPAWSQAALADLVARQTGAQAQAADDIAAMASGSPGLALALADGPALEADRLARRWITGDVPAGETLSIMDGFRGAEGQTKFETIMERLTAAVKREALMGQGAIWAELWGRLVEMPDRAAGLNMDRGDVLAAALTELNRVRASQIVSAAG